MHRQCHGQRCLCHRKQTKCIVRPSSSYPFSVASIETSTTHLILLPVLNPGFVRVVLEHGLPVGLLETLVPDAVAVLLETQDLVVRQLWNELGREIVPEKEVYVFTDFLKDVRNREGKRDTVIL